MFVILSHPRSGTHLLASLLNSHPDLTCYDEVMKLRKIDFPNHLGKKNIFELENNEGCILMYKQFLRSTIKIDGFARHILRAKIIHLTRNNLDDHIKSLCSYNNSKVNSYLYKKHKTHIYRHRASSFKYNFRRLFNISYEEICKNKHISEYENNDLLKFLEVKPFVLTTKYKKGDW